VSSPLMESAEWPGHGSRYGALWTEEFGW
jgi:hypothetical protein